MTRYVWIIESSFIKVVSPVWESERSALGEVQRIARFLGDRKLALTLVPDKEAHTPSGFRRSKAAVDADGRIYAYIRATPLRRGCGYACGRPHYAYGMCQVHLRLERKREASQPAAGKGLSPSQTAAINAAAELLDFRYGEEG